MAYIGKSPTRGVRQRYIYTATGSETSISASDTAKEATGKALSFTDGAYVDVYKNGALLEPNEAYNTNTANTIAGLSSLSSNDVIEVIVFDIFTTADAVSAYNGGTFSGDVVFATNTELKFGDSANFKITSDNTDGSILNYTGDLKIEQYTNDKDIILSSDNGSGGLAEYIKCDGSSGNVYLYNYGNWRFNTNSGGVWVNGNATLDGDVIFTGANYNALWDKSDNALEFTDNAKIKIGSGSDLEIYHDGTDSTIKNTTGDLLIVQDADNENVDILCDNQNGGTSAYFRASGQNGRAILLYAQGGGSSYKLQTTQTGVDVTGTLYCDGFSNSGNSYYDDDARLYFGNNYEVQLWHVHNEGLILKNTSSVNAKLQFGDDGTYITQSADGVLDLVADGELELNGGIVDVNSTNGNVDISATSGTVKLLGDGSHAVHIQSGGYRSDGSDTIALLVGADIGATTLTNNTRKIGGISFPHYNNSEPAFNAIRVDSQSTTSVMSIGGTGETNGVERIEFYCAGNDTDASTLGIRGTFNPSGFFKATNSGNFYNGTDATSGAWHEVNSSIGNEQIFAITCHNTGTDNEGFVVRHVSNTNNTNSGFISCANDINGTKFAVKGNGNVQSATNSYGSTSDERLKSDIKDANSQWNDIKQFKFKNFKKYDTEDLVHLGLIAQEAEKISPNIVSDIKPSALDIKHDSTFGTLYEDGDTIPDGKKVGDVKEIKERVKDIKYSVLYMKAVKALQEAMERIETLEAKVKALEEG